jgi:hypothetical protein
MNDTVMPASPGPRARTEAAAEPPPEWREKLLILIPVFNDWPALALLLASLDRVLATHQLRADVLIVDDASSTEPVAGASGATPLGQIGRVYALRLRRNLGHQRAIAVGLTYAEEATPCDTVIVMDGDGEDDPSDVPRLLQECHAQQDQKVIFAERKRRSESLTFRVFYGLYKILHYALTGRTIRVGNFSALPRSRLKSLIVVSELWNHYAAAVVNSRQPHASIPTRRASRLAGESSMDFVRLVAHGLSAISVYADVVGVRLLVGASAAILAGAALLLGFPILRVGLPFGMPWEVPAIGGFLLLQVAMFGFVISFIFLAERQRLSFIPLRDYHYFVERVSLCYPRRPDAQP